MDFRQEKDDYITQDLQEKNIVRHRNVSVSPPASVQVKTEALPAHDIVLNSIKLPIVKEEQRVFEDPHVDHSYINDSSASPFNETSPKVSTLQELKVRPQFIKEEASVEEEVRVKTETTSNDTVKTTKFKCTTCNLPFRNKYIYKTHRDICSTRISHPPFATNAVKQINFKYRPQKHNVITLRKLIDCVKSNPCLYDVDHENYNNGDLKLVIWSNIASECNLRNGSTASSEWKSLKNQFIKVITQRNTSKRNTSNWLYEKQMEFLLPFLTDEDIHRNIHKDKSNETLVTVEEATNTTDEVMDDNNYTNEVQHTPRLKRVSVSSTQQDAYIKRKRDEERPSTSQSQPLDMFFLSMCATTKNLPEYVQLQVKKKIFQAVIEAEEIVAAMHNDQEKNNMMSNEYENNMSPFSVHSNVNEVWDDN